jgi:hypothetical protein
MKKHVYGTSVQLYFENTTLCFWHQLKGWQKKDDYPRWRGKNNPQLQILPS